MVICHIVRQKSSGRWHVYVHSVAEADGSCQMLAFTEDHEVAVNLRVQSREHDESFMSLQEARVCVEQNGWRLLSEFTGRGWAQLVRGLL